MSAGVSRAVVSVILNKTLTHGQVVSYTVPIELI